MFAALAATALSIAAPVAAHAAPAPVAVSDGDPVYYFGPDNGDDWFYFEDTSTDE